MTTTVSQFCFPTALWVCIIIFIFLFTLWIVQTFSYVRGKFLSQMTSLLVEQEPSLPCHFIWTQMNTNESLLESNAGEMFLSRSSHLPQTPLHSNMHERKLGWSF